MNARAVNKSFSVMQKITQHGIVYLICSGAIHAIRTIVPQYKNSYWVNCGIFGPGLVISATVHEFLWMFAYKSKPIIKCKEIISSNTCGILKKMAKKTFLKCSFTAPILGIAAFENYYKLPFKKTLFRDIVCYAFPTYIFSLSGEWLYDFKYASFYSGSSIGYHLATQHSDRNDNGNFLENLAIELTKCSATADSDVAWYQYIFRLFNEIITGISLSEVFLYNGVEEEEMYEIYKTPYLFLILATTLIFTSEMTAKWAFTPNEQKNDLQNNPLGQGSSTYSSPLLSSVEDTRGPIDVEQTSNKKEIKEHKDIESAVTTEKTQSFLTQTTSSIWKMDKKISREIESKNISSLRFN